MYADRSAAAWPARPPHPTPPRHIAHLRYRGSHAAAGSTAAQPCQRPYTYLPEWSDAERRAEMPGRAGPAALLAALRIWASSPTPSRSPRPSRAGSGIPDSALVVNHRHATLNCLVMWYGGAGWGEYEVGLGMG